jgi:hypothetical protein
VEPVAKPDGVRLYRRRSAGAAAVAAAALLLGGTLEAQVAGVVVPTGRQEYFVLGYEQHLYNMLRRVYDEYGAALAGNRMNSVVSVVASADDQIGRTTTGRTASTPIREPDLRGVDDTRPG